MNGGDDQRRQRPAASDPVLLLLALVEQARRPDQGTSPVLVGVDGRSGSGKSALADDLARLLQARGRAVSVVHLDDVYAGWCGLADALPVVRDDVLTPLRAGRPGRFRRWDWHAGAAAEVAEVLPRPVVVVEGVGAVAADPGGYDVTVWTQAPEAVRRRRAVGRDGSALLQHWDAWAAQEDAVLGPGCDDAPPWPVHLVVRTGDHG